MKRGFALIELVLFWWDRFSYNVAAHRIIPPPTSRHPGGVQTLRCDGTVLFVKNSINPAICGALGGRSGREIFWGDSF